MGRDHPQRRSSKLYAQLAEIVQSGAIGKVTVARAGLTDNMSPHGIGKLPDTHNAILGYQSIYLLARALRAAGSTDAKALANAMKSMHNVRLTGSTIVGFPSNTAHRSVAVVGYGANGRFKKIETFIP